MSAIYGAVSFGKQRYFTEVASNFKSEYGKYAVERVDELVKEHAFFGCAHQYFADYAKSEVLPKEDDALIFTADCVLDNRKELIKELKVQETATDGELLRLAWRKWQKEAPLHLHGVYAFAGYDKQNNEVFLANDRFAQRCLFYTVREKDVFFSTLLFPLLKCSRLSFEKNERWLVDEISQRGPSMISESRETAILGVYKVAAGTCISIKKSENELKTEIIRYYEPKKMYRVNRKITPEKSEAMIRDVMTKTLGEILQNDVKTATQLSCGLDSTAVSCNAAILMGKQGKSIESFTSVPLKEAGLVNKGGLIFDETEGVMKVCEAYPNIQPYFVECKDRNYLEEAADIINYWELPCKSQQNAVWSDEIYRLAARRGCKIMLTGSTGNCSLSAGSIEESLFEHLRHFRLIRAYRTLGIARNAGISRKRYLKKLWKLIRANRAAKKTPESFYSNNFTRTDVGEKYNTAERLLGKSRFLPFGDLKTMREFFYYEKSYAQIGEIETKLSLRYGILSRDPMRTDDMMKLCYSLPVECFAYDDYDRRLVREGMRGIVPESIRHDVIHRGRQSADMYYRMGKQWKQKLPEIREALNAPGVQEILSKERIEEWLKDLSADNLEEHQDEVLMVVDVYSFALYIELLNHLLQK